MIKAVHLSGVGGDPDDNDWEPIEETDVIKFNWLLHTKKSNVYPPLKIINEYLSRGINEHGMSGGMFWEPCQIDYEKYQSYIQSIGGKILDANEIPEDITLIEHWYLYKYEIECNIPYAQNRVYWNRTHELREKILAARSIHDQELAGNLELEYNKAATESGNFFREHFKRQ